MKITRAYLIALFVFGCSNGAEFLPEVGRGASNLVGKEESDRKSDKSASVDEGKSDVENDDKKSDSDLDGDNEETYCWAVIAQSRSLPPSNFYACKPYNEVNGIKNSFGLDEHPLGYGEIRCFPSEAECKDSLVCSTDGIVPQPPPGSPFDNNCFGVPK